MSARLVVSQDAASFVYLVAELCQSAQLVAFSCRLRIYLLIVQHLEDANVLKVLNDVRTIFEAKMVESALTRRTSEVMSLG